MTEERRNMFKKEKKTFKKEKYAPQSLKINFNIAGHIDLQLPFRPLYSNLPNESIQ